MTDGCAIMANVYSVKECSSGNETYSVDGRKEIVDRTHLVNVLMSRSEDFPFRKDNFAWGQQLQGIILNSIHIQGLGDIQVPINVKVHFLLLNF